MATHDGATASIVWDQDAKPPCYIVWLDSLHGQHLHALPKRLVDTSTTYDLFGASQDDEGSAVIQVRPIGSPPLYGRKWKFLCTIRGAEVRTTIIAYLEMLK